VHWSSPKIEKEIDNIIQFIKNGTEDSGLRFVTKMTTTDNYRNQNFKDTHPEIALAMGYE
jgi:hypothetical protein